VRLELLLGIVGLAVIAVAVGFASAV